MTLTELRSKLTELRWQIGKQDATHYGCDWYAYKRSALPARECECNHGGAQIVITPYSYPAPIADVWESVDVSIRGEHRGIWWKLDAYSLPPGEAMGNLETIERSLVAAWNAL